MHLIIKRFLAFMVDWLIIVFYACTLFGVMMILASQNIVTLGPMHPIKGQLIAFFSLTLPVILYYVFMENSARHGTIGKKIMKIRVSGTTGSIILRNVIKFLPWEFAHAGILWINYTGDAETQVWIWVLLILPQVVVAGYLISIIYTRGARSLYDNLAGTEVSNIN